MDKQKKPFAYRLLPCPAYDLEGLESYFADMAAEGLLLCRDGLFASIAKFERAGAGAYRYRLEAAPKRRSLWDGNGGEPDGDLMALSKRCGWEYVAALGQFYIFRSAGPSAREMNTDSRVQALAQLQKRERGAVFTCLFWALISPLFYIRGELLLLMLSGGTCFVLWGMLLLLWLFGDILARAIHLKRLKKKLLAGRSLEHGKAWRKRALRHRLLSLGLLALCLLWIGIFLRRWGDSVTGAGKIPLEEYTGEVPFATMADFGPGGEYALEDFGISNTVEIRTDWLSPLMVDWNEIASIGFADGRCLSGGLYVDYCEMRTPWLAQELAREFHHRDARAKGYSPVELEDLDLDYAAAYQDEAYMSTLVLRQGRHVLRASFYQTSPNYRLELSAWAKILAGSMMGQ